MLKLADVQARLQAIGLEPVGGTPAQAAAFVKQEAVRWHEVIVKNDIRVE